MLRKTILLLAIVLISACTEQKNVSSTSGGKPQLLAFLNPNGSPCQMQRAILNELGGKVTSKVEIKNYFTTSQSDQDAFYKYGVRGLPSLILIDSKGEVVKRFSPGIQSSSDIVEAIESCKC